MHTINIKYHIKKSKKLVNSTQKTKKLEKMRIKYLINRESAKKNLKKGKKARLIFFKGLRHPLIFIKVRIPLKKRVSFIKIYKK